MCIRDRTVLVFIQQLRQELNAFLKALADPFLAVKRRDPEQRTEDIRQTELRPGIKDIDHFLSDLIQPCLLYTSTHQDVGQIDMYVRMYDDLKRGQGDNPTIGILLCSETDEDIARYSVLHDNDRLFMSKYLTYLPTKEQLKAEIERQKEIFSMQHPVLQENWE